MLNYNPHDWYWAVADYPTQVWSSKTLSYIGVNTPDYKKWQATGRRPTPMATPAELKQVMERFVMPRLMQDGITLTSTSNAALAGRYALDDNRLAMMSRLANGMTAKRPLPSASKTLEFADADGVSHTFTQPQFVEFVNGCEAYLYKWAEALANNVAAKAVPYPKREIKIA